MTKDIYLTPQDFNNALDNYLTIVSYPENRMPYYVCKNQESIVHVYIKK